VEANDALVVKNLKFIILSSQEDDLRLVEEAKARECKRKLLVNRDEDIGKEGVETADSINRGNGKLIGYPLLYKHLLKREVPMRWKGDGMMREEMKRKVIMENTEKSVTKERIMVVPKDVFQLPCMVLLQPMAQFPMILMVRRANRF